MKNRFTQLLAAVLLSVVLVSCNDNAQPAPQQPVAIAVQAAPPPVPVADNLLADNWEFVLDASGSMGSSACGTGGNARMETAKDGTMKFSRSLPESANLGLIVFSDHDRGGIQEWLKLGTGAGNRTEFIKLVSGIRPYGGTPLRSAIELGVAALNRQSQMQRGYGTYHLVVVTDGDADVGQDPSNYVKKLVATTPISVHTIGFCVDGRHSLDIKGVTQYASASNPQTLEQGLKAILAESESYVDAQFKK